MTSREGEGLKPCPFCGEQPRTIDGDDEYGAQVFCVCKAEPMIQEPRGAMDAAVMWWNRRVPAVTARAERVERREFEYLLNAMEAAGQYVNPAAHGYGDKRKALFAWVHSLCDRYEAARAELEETRTNMHSEYDRRDREIAALRAEVAALRERVWTPADGMWLVTNEGRSKSWVSPAPMGDAAGIVAARIDDVAAAIVKQRDTPKNSAYDIALAIVAALSRPAAEKGEGDAE